MKKRELKKFWDRSSQALIYSTDVEQFVASTKHTGCRAVGELYDAFPVKGVQKDLFLNGSETETDIERQAGPDMQRNARAKKTPRASERWPAPPRRKQQSTEFACSRNACKERAFQKLASMHDWVFDFGFASIGRFKAEW